MTTSATGSIDTSALDVFRQGVELTHPKHFVAGLAKIWSGWENHEVPQLQFGQSTAHDQDTPFQDSVKYDSQSYLALPKSDKILIERLEGEMLKRLADGALDPLGARSGSLGGGPVPDRGISGELVGGGTNEFKESVQIVTEYVPALTGSSFLAPPFVDSYAVLARLTYVSGTFRLPHATYTTPFSDSFPVSVLMQQKIGLMMPMSMSSDFREARLRLNPSGSSERVGHGKMAMTAGFMFGDSPRGIDSLAFGGMTFSRSGST